MAEAGRRLGEFVLREKLGQGAFGEVYRAEQPMLMREAVVKVLHTRHRGNQKLRGRFLREARLASRLDHPLAAHVYAFGTEDDGTLWIAMELVRGTPLDRYLRETGPLPPERFVPLLEQICDVVHSAHEKGIVHRDLKPANIMVTARKEGLVPTLLDFGLARVVDEVEDASGVSILPPSAPELTQAGAQVGSPLYMAPEQWGAPGTADARSDQYSLGILSFECLSGRVPFSGGVTAVAQAHIRRPIPSLGADLTLLDPVLARATAKLQRDRFASVLELAQALRRAAGLEREPPLPPLPEALERAMLWAPQPIADAIAALAGARNPHQALDCVEAVEQSVRRTVGAIALAGLTRGTPARPPERLRALRQRNLEPDEHLALIRELLLPYAGAPEDFPVPELVKWAPEAADSPEPGPSGDLDVGARLRQRLEGLSALLAGLAFLGDYPLVVPRRERGGAEVWMGPRRISQPVIDTEGRLLPEGRPVLVDRRGRVLLALYPLAQVLAPVPGAEEELFLFAGPGRRGARLVASPLGFERFDEGIWEWMRQLLDEELRAAEPTPETEPYPGLRSFTANEAALFLGREAETAAFVNRLRRQSLLVVAGPSGSGKSSFVHAGVVPSLPAGWRVLSLRPGRTPLELLCTRAAQELGVALSPAALAASPAALGEALRGAGPLVLVVDQFEEAFTLVDAATTAQLASALALAAGDQVRVILTLRDDFLARANQLAPLTDRLSGALVLLATPAPADLLRIVVEPARRAGYDFDDPDLPARMVEEVAGKPGALPLLAFTAASLWEHRDRHFRQLTDRAYRSLGGVGGALAQHADGLLAGMSTAERAKVREAFRHLVTAEGTRATISRAELAELAGEGVVEKLIAARLLGASEERQVEIVHEALVVSWPRLSDWRREDVEGARLLAELRAAARTWHERGRPRGLLWREEALAEYQLWRARSPAALTEGERAFAASSLGEAARGRRLRALLAATAIAVLGAVAILLYLFGQRAERAAAENQRRLVATYQDQGRQLLLAGDAQRGLAYLQETRRQGGRGAALDFLVARGIEALAPQKAVLADRDLLVAALFTGRDRVMTATRGGDLTLWVGAKETRRQRAHESGLRAAVASPDGTRVLTGGSDGRARLWAAVDGELLHTLPHAGEVADVGFGGARVITGSRDRTAKVWDATSGALVATLAAGGPVAAVALSADGRLALTGSDGGEVALWSADDGRRIATLRAAGDPVVRVVLTGDRAAAASGSAAGLWDLASAAPVAELQHQARLRDLAASADGTRLVTASQDGTGRIWEARTGKLLGVLVGHDGWVYMARFCAGDALVVTGGTDRTVRTWDTATGHLRRTLVGHRDLVRHVACDGGRVLSAGFDRTARLWDPGHLPVRGFIAAGSKLGDMSLSPDGTRLVTVGLEGEVRVTDVASGALVATLGRAGTHPIGARFGADGRTVILALFDEGVAELWDVERSQLVRTFAGHTDRVGRVEPSPDGRLLLTASRDGTARLWALDTGALLRTLSGHEGWVLSVGFSPDGQLLATGGQDQTVRLWDAASGTEQRRLVGHSSWIQRTVFDATGARLLTASSDATAKIWDPRSGALLASLEGHTVSCTAAAWSPSGALVATIGDDDRADVWDAASGQLLHVIPSGHELRGRVAFLGEETLLTAGEGDDRVTEWDLHADHRPAAELDEALGCLVPFELRGGTLVPRAVEAGCGAGR